MSRAQGSAATVTLIREMIALSARFADCDLQDLTVQSALDELHNDPHFDRVRFAAREAWRLMFPSVARENEAVYAKGYWEG
jgi:hypothetical protein